MPATLTYPGVYIQEQPSGVHPITGVATSIAAFIGWAAKGPTDEAAHIYSFDDYVRNFGPLDPRSYLGYAVSHFFLNGGSEAYVVRLIADAAATKKPAKASAKAGDLTVTVKNEGSWGNAYYIKVTAKDYPNKNHFRLSVGVKNPLAPSTATGDAQYTVVEKFENLSLSANDPRYVETVLSDASEIVDGAVADKAKDFTDDVDWTQCTNGEEGDVLDPAGTKAAFVKALTADGAGYHFLEQVDLFNLLVVPGLTDATALNGLLQELCIPRRAFLIADPDPNITTSDGLLKYLAGDGKALNQDPPSRNSALYFPWVSAPDPMQEGRLQTFPPSGFVAGVYANTDASRGVWKAPAGTAAGLSGAAGLETVLSDAQNGSLNVKGVNCLRSFPVYGNVVWGARTLAGADDAASADWKYVPVRRLTLYIEESLYRGTKWVVFEPNDEPLWAQIRLNVGAFMDTLFRQRAFQGASPRDAYLVKCDSTTTTQNDINRGVVNIVVGFAPLKPAEFVVITIQQLAGQAGA
jgi:phage tail sheath protein FI